MSRHRRSGPLRAPDYGEASTPHADTRAGAIASASPYRQDGHSFPAGNRSPRDQQTANAGADTTTAVRPYAVLGSARRSHFALCGMAGRAGQIGQDRFHWSSQKRRPPSDNAEAFVLHDLRRIPRRPVGHPRHFRLSAGIGDRAYEARTSQGLRPYAYLDEKRFARRMGRAAADDP